MIGNGSLRSTKYNRTGFSKSNQLLGRSQGRLVSLTFSWKKGKTILVSGIHQVSNSFTLTFFIIVEQEQKIAKENRKIILNLKNIINHPSTTGLIMGLHEDPDYISPRERIRRFKVKSR